MPNAQVAGPPRRRTRAAAGISSRPARRHSQDDGSFVVGNLTPGRYYLSAGFRKVDEAGPPARKPEREKYVTTYFPSAADSASAAPVEVAAGAEVRDLAIRLRKSRVFHIRGRAGGRGERRPRADRSPTGSRQRSPGRIRHRGRAARRRRPFRIRAAFCPAPIDPDRHSRGVFFTTGDDETVIGKRPSQSDRTGRRRRDRRRSSRMSSLRWGRAPPSPAN